MSNVGVEPEFQISKETAREFLEGVHSRESVSGLTHAFYRYPARFSPNFAKAAIRAFSSRGDLVLDPFMGGATTIVEACALGRKAIGLDINSLSHFIAKSKTVVQPETSLTSVERWVDSIVPTINMRSRSPRASNWIELGYHRNLSTRKTWAIRKSLEQALDRLVDLETDEQRMLARAILLRAAQWALDCRTDVPSASEFRDAIIEFQREMVAGAREFRTQVASHHGLDASKERGFEPLLLNRSAVGLESDQSIVDLGAPRLVLTSPPYPGVHVMYHRWQIMGRRETPAPYWIANTLDGNGLSHYTFGDRHHPGLRTYFESVRQNFASIAKVADGKTLIIQMVAFSDASWQLPKYLETLQSSGLEEISVPELVDAPGERIWRGVPNRKWYADTKRGGGVTEEVVLFHRKYEGA